MLQRSCGEISDDDVIAFLGAYFGTTDIETIFLKAGREYIKDIPSIEGKGKCGSLKDGVNFYFRNYQANSTIPFYLRSTYEKILADSKVKPKE